MPRRGDDGGFERMMRGYFGEQFVLLKPQDADAKGDLTLSLRFLPLLAGEAKGYRDRADARKSHNPTLRAIRDALNGARKAAEALQGIPWGVVKRTGKGQPEDQLIVMEARHFVQLLQAFRQVTDMLDTQHPPAKVES